MSKKDDWLEPFIRECVGFYPTDIEIFYMKLFNSKNLCRRDITFRENKIVLRGISYEHMDIEKDVIKLTEVGEAIAKGAKKLRDKDKEWFSK